MSKIIKISQKKSVTKPLVTEMTDAEKLFLDLIAKIIVNKICNSNEESNHIRANK